MLFLMGFYYGEGILLAENHSNNIYTINGLIQQPRSPDDWAMPESMARRVCKSINKNRITLEDELQDEFSDLAYDLRLIELDASD